MKLKYLALQGLLIICLVFWMGSPAFSQETQAVDTVLKTDAGGRPDDWYDPEVRNENDETWYDDEGNEHSPSIFRQSAKRIYGWLYNLVRSTTGMGDLGTSFTVLIIILIAAFFFV